jgi:hypothetical protein
MNRYEGHWHGMPRWTKIVSYVLLGLLGAAALGLVFGFVVQWLWNWLMPGIFHLKEIGYWESVGIVILARLIFGSFGGEYDGGHASKKQKQRMYAGKKKEGCKNWQYYDEWWENEGEKAFESYAEREKEKEKDKDNGRE